MQIAINILSILFVIYLLWMARVKHTYVWVTLGQDRWTKGTVDLDWSNGVTKPPYFFSYPKLDVFYLLLNISNAFTIVAKSSNWKWKVQRCICIQSLFATQTNHYYQFLQLTMKNTLEGHLSRQTSFRSSYFSNLFFTIVSRMSQCAERKEFRLWISR